jgi:hypothetical protein
VDLVYWISARNISQSVMNMEANLEVGGSRVLFSILSTAYISETMLQSSSIAILGLADSKGPEPAHASQQRNVTCLSK